MYRGTRKSAHGAWLKTVCHVCHFADCPVPVPVLINRIKEIVSFFVKPCNLPLAIRRLIQHQDPMAYGLWHASATLLQDSGTSAERAPAFDKAFLRKATWRYPTVIFKNLDSLRYCFSVQALFLCIVFLNHVKHLQIHAMGATSTSANCRHKNYMHALRLVACIWQSTCIATPQHLSLQHDDGAAPRPVGGRMHDFADTSVRCFRGISSAARSLSDHRKGRPNVPH